MHIQHGATLEEILMENFATEGGDSVPPQYLQNLHQTVMDVLYDVQRRNEAMLFYHLPPRVLGTLSSALSDIKVRRTNCDLATSRNCLSFVPIAAQFDIRENRHVERRPL